MDKNDADFVVIIHTNTETMGYRFPVGNLDFYINDGYRQPWCPLPSSMIDRWKNKASCSHTFSLRLFVEFIKNDVPCYFIGNSSKLRLDENLLNFKHITVTNVTLTWISKEPVFYLDDLSRRSNDLHGKYNVQVDEQARTCRY